MSLNCLILIMKGEIVKDKYFITCSGGNDSVALIQYMYQHHSSNSNYVIYNNTGWAVYWWADRMKMIRSWIESLGFIYIETKADMKSLIRNKGGWPMPASKMQFCTKNLKEKPSLDVYNKIDPEKDYVVVTGRRREESRNRAELPLWQYESSKHGGRDVYNPLVDVKENERDSLINKTPLPVLATQSLECYPCICANKSSTVLRELPESRIKEIEDFELSLGKNGKGNPRTMFRPYRCGGAIGIRQVVEWANGSRGWKVKEYPERYKNLPIKKGGEKLDVFIPYAGACNGGFCGN